MTKRQLNSTYLKLRRQVHKLRKEYWKLFEACLATGNGVPFYFHDVTWIRAYKPRRKAHIDSLRFERSKYKRRIQQLLLERVCQN